MEAKKPNSRKLKAIETKKRIFESAEKLIKIHGLENLSVDSIVEKAGVSKGAFYVHYESKASLITEYVSKLDFDYEKYFKTIPTDKKPSELLILMTEKIADILMNNIGYDLLRIIYEALLDKNNDAADVMSYNRKLYKMYWQIIQQGVQQGEFKASLDIDSISNHCIMSLRGLTFEWCVRFPEFDLKKEALVHIDILLTGIKNSNPAGHNEN